MVLSRRRFLRTGAKQCCPRHHYFMPFVTFILRHNSLNLWDGRIHSFRSRLVIIWGWGCDRNHKKKSGNLTKFEKKDMIKTFKFKKWPLLWPLSQKWLRFQTWTIKAHWKMGLLLISLTSLVDFQLNGAEI